MLTVTAAIFLFSGRIKVIGNDKIGGTAGAGSSYERDVCALFASRNI